MTKSPPHSPKLNPQSQEENFISSKRKSFHAFVPVKRNHVVQEGGRDNIVILYFIIHCAQYDGFVQYYKNKSYILKKGQWICSRSDIEKWSCLSEQSVKTALKHFISANQALTNVLTSEVTNEGTLYTVVNIEDFIHSNNKVTSEVTSEVNGKSPVPLYIYKEEQRNNNKRNCYKEKSSDFDSDFNQETEIDFNQELEERIMEFDRIESDEDYAEEINMSNISEGSKEDSAGLEGQEGVEEVVRRNSYQDGNKHHSTVKESGKELTLQEENNLNLEKVLKMLEKKYRSEEELESGMVVRDAYVYAYISLLSNTSLTSEYEVCDLLEKLGYYDAVEGIGRDKLRPSGIFNLFERDMPDILKKHIDNSNRFKVLETKLEAKTKPSMPIRNCGIYLVKFFEELLVKMHKNEGTTIKDPIYFIKRNKLESEWVNFFEKCKYLYLAENIL